MINYSVLMSVYAKEDPQHVRLALDSILNQTVRTNDFVIVCDGPLTPALDQLLEEYRTAEPEIMHIVRMEKNQGIGAAAALGLTCCRNELVAKMDSDDIAHPTRCEKQLERFAQNPELTVLGCQIQEFHTDPGSPMSIRRVPETNEKIRAYARKRQPFNNMTVMYRKTAVQQVGGYRKLRRGEDFDLYIRLLKAGFYCENLPEVLVSVRVPENAIKRRGSWDTFVGFVASRWNSLRIGYCSPLDFLICVAAQLFLMVCPTGLRNRAYLLFLRRQPKRVAVIGHFGGGEFFCDGQTVKTRNLAELLEKDAKLPVFKVDTYYFRKNKFKLLLDTLKALLRCSHIFLMVSENGMRFYLPFLYVLNAIPRRHIYHYIIGSELLDMVSADKRLVKYLNALDVNWFEYESGARFLRQQGVTNVEVLPNFKRITPVDKASEYVPQQGEYRFCTFSRVMAEKGIDDAVAAVAELNREQGAILARLDIYGPVEPGYRQHFDELVRDHGDCVRYMGVADSGAGVELLKDYYALLFPTRWRGEGFPGTILDAFAAGIPVIASDWNANKEVLQAGEQGILYPDAQYGTLKEAVSWALKHEAEMNRMRHNSRRTYDSYTPEAILDRVLARMNENELK